MSLRQILLGPTGEFETTRVLGVSGTALYAFAAHAFLAWDVFARHHRFDLGTYCTAFPGGFSAMVLIVAGGAALKDRQGAQARRIEREGGAAS